MTIFSAGIVTDSSKPEEAKALIAFLASPAAAAAIRGGTGLPADERAEAYPWHRYRRWVGDQVTAANGEAAMSGDGWFHHRHAVGNDSFLRTADGRSRRKAAVADRGVDAALAETAPQLGRDPLPRNVARPQQGLRREGLWQIAELAPAR
jgi:ABC-type glycerol-3-phosphate transport system substrate-binding protein